MSVTVNVYEAKARLSELISLVEAGEEVIVARNGTPVVRLDLFFPPTERALGFVALGAEPVDFYAPLTDDDLAVWEA
ncbi:hypothetical protein Back2_08420 [Nocardioides baekrokdamisoli]|uniref:Uncharacterized protein n=1 Tax=Nocardioides baekrokdamisoli TaxID=1804624 RepID=A0A3G9IKF3_9ACTN|nr:type II toxin-antitoxin system prevent-host-death family antitoxin [Nocardioides baekrokdamisoli]BBH16555.1 hypothetical protein Back2_08420 [Nocardioides baekrokdamisoli]